MQEKLTLKQKIKRLPLYAVIIITVLCFLIGTVLSVFLIGELYLALPVANYYKNSERAFKLPGLNEGLVHQGIDYDKNSDCFFITGYDMNDGASPIYLVNKESGQTVKKVLMLNADGTDFTGHTGGIVINGDYVYIAGSSHNCIYVFAYADVISAQNNSGVNCLGRIMLKTSDSDYIKVSFIAPTEDGIIAGEYVDGGKYIALASHQIKTDNGNTNNALAIKLVYDSASPFNLNPTPVHAYSLPNRVQGVMVDGEDFYLSTSYGFTFSKIYKYSNLTSSAQKIEILDTITPLTVLSENNLTKTYRTPPMAEQMVKVQDKTYILNESASQKYVFGKFTGAKWCYATDFSNMK